MAYVSPGAEHDLAGCEQLAAAERWTRRSGGARRRSRGRRSTRCAPPTPRRGGSRSRRCRRPAAGWRRARCGRAGPRGPRCPAANGVPLRRAFAAPAPGEVEQLGGDRRHGQHRRQLAYLVGLVGVVAQPVPQGQQPDRVEGDLDGQGQPHARVRRPHGHPRRPIPVVPSSPCGTRTGPRRRHAPARRRPADQPFATRVPAVPGGLPPFPLCPPTSSTSRLSRWKAVVQSRPARWPASRVGRSSRRSPRAAGSARSARRAARHHRRHGGVDQGRQVVGGHRAEVGPPVDDPGAPGRARRAPGCGPRRGGSRSDGHGAISGAGTPASVTVGEVAGCQYARERYACGSYSCLPGIPLSRACAGGRWGHRLIPWWRPERSRPGPDELLLQQKKIDQGREGDHDRAGRHQVVVGEELATQVVQRAGHRELVAGWSSTVAQKNSL